MIAYSSSAAGDMQCNTEVVHNRAHKYVLNRLYHRGACVCPLPRHAVARMDEFAANVTFELLQLSCHSKYVNSKGFHFRGYTHFQSPDAKDDNQIRNLQPDYDF